jgi:hypothetical protein
MFNTQRSKELFAEAQKLLPGGVDSPVRAFRAVGGQPLFIDRGQGAYLYDVDGNHYIDYVLSWGPLILGHAHPRVVSALTEAVARGTSYGAPSPLELELAKLIQQFVPSLEMLRFVNSGTEATMTALRLARAFTGRNNIIATILLSSRVVTTATRICCSSKPAPAWRRSDCRIRPACLRRRSRIRSSRRSTIWRRCKNFLSSSRARSPP